MRYEKILVAIDLTLESEKILNVAKDISDNKLDKIYVAYVIEPATPSLPIAPYLQGLSDDQSIMIVEARLRLNEIADQAGIPRDNQLILMGSPAEAISTQAAERSVDLVVIGKHARTPWAALFGTTETSVSKTVECDVLTVSISDEELSEAKQEASQHLTEDMIKTPSKYFKHPDQVREYPNLTISERIKILESWKNEIIALMKAAEENLDEELNEDTGYELKEINDALETEKANN